MQQTLTGLADEIRDASWELALEVVEEGLRDDAVPSLQRLGQVGQVGDMPTFIVELSRELADPQPARLRRGGPLAALVREHAREREALGFAPREIVTELLVLRRVLLGFVSKRASELTGEEVLEAERRLNDSLDVLVAECVVAYFDRATAELADLARRDPLTGLLNHTTFGTAVDDELFRARRYERGLTLVYVDVDDFKRINDTLGHLEGDRVLQRVSSILTESLRASDLAGRLGGDEFAVCLIESDVETGGRFLARFHDLIDEEVVSGRLPEGFSVSAGLASYPHDAVAADALLRLADERLYEAKREKAVDQEGSTK
jgi:diguanylate cyclase (GGDEF)-like protein